MIIAMIVMIAMATLIARFLQVVALLFRLPTMLSVLAFRVLQSPFRFMDPLSAFVIPVLGSQQGRAGNQENSAQSNGT